MKSKEYSEDSQEMTALIGEEMMNTSDALARGSEEMLNQLCNYESAGMRMPIAQLGALGAGVASMLPVFRTITQTTTIPVEGLYRVANAGAGDVLKLARNGNAWGALKTAAGGSKMAQLQAVSGIEATSTAVSVINPATVMMAVALFSLEQKLGKIEETEQKILSFLNTEKEAEIEADAETLLGMLSQYKFNWDNEMFVQSNHQMTLQIQRTARKNMDSYQKAVSGILGKKVFPAQSKVNSTMKELQGKFRYYRLSLYTFSMASLLEILLSGNFEEESIRESQRKIEKMSLQYRELYSGCSVFLEKMGKLSLEAHILCGVGSTSDAVGKWIGSIPVVKEGLVDEYLQSKGARIKDHAGEMRTEAMEEFSELRDPQTHVFLEKMDDMIRIYNHTSAIRVEGGQLCLLAG